MPPLSRVPHTPSYLSLIPMQNRVLPLLFVCAAATVLALQGWGRDAVAFELQSPLSETRTPEPVPPTLAVIPAGRERAAAHNPRPTPAPSPAFQTSTNRSALAEASLHGELISITDGRQTRVDKGRFTLRFWSGATWRVERVEVTDGRWSAPWQAATRLEVTDVFIGDRPARVASADLSLADKGEQEILVCPAEPSLLHVRSSESGLSLDRLTLVAGRGDETHPADSPIHPLGSDQSSPLDLDQLLKLPFVSGPMDYWVCAPGYAWGRVTIDHLRGGERTLSLKRGCALEVVDLDVPLPSQALLCVRIAHEGRIEQRPFLEVRPQPVGTTLIPGLPPGRYEVCLEDRTVPGEVLARGEIDVQGAHETVALKAVARPADFPLLLRGTLALPDAWGLAVGPLCLCPTDATLGFGAQITIPLDEMTEGPARVFEWNAGEVKPGRYSAHLRGTGFRTVVELKQSAEPLRLVVSAPAQLEVLVTAGPGALMPDDLKLTWALLDQESGRLARGMRVGPEPMVMIAPAGAVQLDLISVGTGRLVSSRRVQTRPGVNKVRMVLQPRRGVHVVLLDGTTELPWEAGSCSLRATHLASGVTTEGSGGRFELGQSGLHEVHLCLPEEYATVEPQLVQVTEGAVSELVFHLQRKL